MFFSRHRSCAPAHRQISLRFATHFYIHLLHRSFVPETFDFTIRYTSAMQLALLLRILATLIAWDLYQRGCLAFLWHPPTRSKRISPRFGVSQWSAFIEKMLTNTFLLCTGPAK
jgi:hypothetical protein